MVITIDGPAGVGKSTVAALVAERLGLRYVNTGQMYRELTAVALERGVSLNDGQVLAGLIGEPGPTGADLRSEAISGNVSSVARHPQVRARMRARQRELATDAVLEGRDTGSIVCPQADLKVFLVASSRVRAERRARQVRLPVEQVEQAIVERDSLDSEQSAPAPDAVLIDTGGMDASQVADRIVELARERV